MYRHHCSHIPLQVQGKALIIVLVAVAAMLGGLTASRFLLQEPVEFRAASMFPEPRQLQPFELVDGNGQPFTEADLTDRYTLVFFGFTNCPDICPDTLNQVAEAKRRLELMRVEQSNLPRVVFVSVDPERDEGQAMLDYVTWFDDDFKAITGSDEALQELTRQVGALYVRMAPDESGFYSVDHSGMIVIIDPEAQMIGRFAQPIDTESMVADLFELSRRG